MVRWSVAVPAAPAVRPLATAAHVLVALQTGVLSSRKIEDGAEEWSTRLAVDQTMAADDARVYVAAGTTLHALRLSDGAPTWSLETGKVVAPPVATSEWLVIAAGGKVSAIRPIDGRVAWTREIGTVEQAPALDDNTLYVSLLDGRLLALDIASGATRWEQTLGADPTEPLVSDGRVYIGAEKTFLALHTSDGEVDWQWRVGARVLGKAVADASHVYYIAMDNVLRAHARGSGALRWKQALAFRPTSGPVLIGGYLTVPSPTPELRAFNPATGKAAGTLTLADPIEAVPAFVERPPPSDAAILAVTGNLKNEWKLWMAVPGAPALPSVAPLTALPGTTTPPGL